MGEATLQLRAVKITGSGVGDAPMLPVVADPRGRSDRLSDSRWEYAGSALHDSIADGGAEAIIPPLRNVKHWKKDSLGAGARSEPPRAIGRVGRTI